MNVKLDDLRPFNHANFQTLLKLCEDNWHLIDRPQPEVVEEPEVESDEDE